MGAILDSIPAIFDEIAFIGGIVAAAIFLGLAIFNAFKRGAL